MIKSHKGEYRVRGKEGPSFWIPAYAISTVLLTGVSLLPNVRLVDEVVQGDVRGPQYVPDLGLAVPLQDLVHLGLRLQTILASA